MTSGFRIAPMAACVAGMASATQVPKNGRPGAGPAAAMVSLGIGLALLAAGPAAAGAALVRRR